MEKNLLLILATISILAAGSTFAETAKPDPKEIETLIAQLGSDSFKQRIAAEKKLKAMAKDIQPQLEKHIEAKDPEIRVRVRKILQGLALAKAPPPPEPPPDFDDGDVAEEFPYTMIAGETLKDIAHKFGVTEAGIRDRNPAVKIFKAGTVILIPPLEF